MEQTFLDSLILMLLWLAFLALIFGLGGMIADRIGNSLARKKRLDFQRDLAANMPAYFKRQAD